MNVLGNFCVVFLIIGLMSIIGTEAPMAMSDDGVDIVFDSSITDTTGASSVTGSFFKVADMVYDLGQMPSGFLETGSIVHCACLAHSFDATTDGFVYYADDGRCWTTYQAPTNPIVGGVTLRVGTRQVDTPIAEETGKTQDMSMDEEPITNNIMVMG